LNYEGKRDRWNGYDPNQYKVVIAEWNEVNDEMKKKKVKELEEKLKNNA
jgi:pre-mRNA-processing factor SLU7